MVSRPASAATIFASARAAASRAAASASAATTIFDRTLPFTCTGTSMVSSTSSAGSASGNADQTIESSWPNRVHSSSAMCGASGDSIATIGSASPRGVPPCGYAWVTALFSSVMRAIEVLKRSVS